MMATISRLYSNRQIAQRVVEDLMAAGLPEDDVGVLSHTESHPMENADVENSGDVTDRDRDGRDDRNESVGKGAAIGSAAGLLAGLSTVVIPGFGAIFAAGWFGSALVGALAGSAVGGVAGALKEAGISDNDAAGFSEGIEKGGTLVTIRVRDEDRALYADILDAGGVARDREVSDPSGLSMPR